MWDLESLGFLNDAPLWNMNGGFMMNEMGIPQMHDFLLDNQPGFVASNTLQDRVDNPSLPCGRKSPAVMDMRDIWFTNIKRDDHLCNRPPSIVRRTSISRSVTSPDEPELVDEDCRRELSKALTHPPPQEDLLPSSRFLNLSDKFIGHSTDEIVAMIQAATLGQTFAMLSGDAKHLAIFDSYHGSLISFARRENMFEARPEMKPPEVSSDEQLESSWKEWTRQEQLRRVGLALHIHDAELSFLYHRDSLLKHRRSENETLETSLAFNATTAREWEASLRTREDIRFNGSDSHHSTPVDPFAVYLKLEALGVLIAEDRRQGCLKTTSKSYEDKLLRWHKSFYQNNPADQDDELCLLPLWHWTFINLLVDVDKIESAIGRDGPERGFQALEYITNWAATKDAARCMMHAFLLQRRLEALKLDHTPALHVPRIAFSAAIVSYCFITYGPGNDPLNGASNLINTTHPEFRILGEHVKELTYLSRLTWNRTATSSVTAATLCVLNGLLEMMGVWGLAGRFAKIIARLIDGEA
ncbi:hypothetical protein IFR04_003148 [Cadophora malorum]|uniref:Transcription factor domain-containing protein n=1 Tax=Cadophora malorum TaxID=108018 RepID=A0A8H7WFE6_9HELO|nr:hypothetical protein IFR04_003148 [Cadophora malorum]